MTEEQEQASEQTDIGINREKDVSTSSPYSEEVHSLHDAVPKYIHTRDQGLQKQSER